jgi:hypothetical protein
VQAADNEQDFSPMSAHNQAEAREHQAPK